MSEIDKKLEQIIIISEELYKLAISSLEGNLMLIPDIDEIINYDILKMNELFKEVQEVNKEKAIEFIEEAKLDSELIKNPRNKNYSNRIKKIKGKIKQPKAYFIRF